MKATIKRFFLRDVFGQLSEIVNARQEISRGKSDYGVYWKFYEVTKDEFIQNINNKMGCVETLSGKFVEVDEKDVGKFTNY